MKSLSRFFLLSFFLFFVCKHSNSSSPVTSETLSGAYLADLGGFSAKKLQLQAAFQQDRVILNWNSDGIKKGTYFVVQRSEDGKEWNFVGGLASPKTQNGFQEYTFEDENLSAKTYFYQLKKVNAKGDIQFSNAVMVNISIVPQVLIVPNPVKEFFQLHLPPSPASGYSINLVNAAGQVILAQQHAPSDTPIQTKMNVNHLPAGIYWITIYTNEKRFTHRLLKL